MKVEYNIFNEIKNKPSNFNNKISSTNNEKDNLKNMKLL